MAHEDLARETADGAATLAGYSPIAIRELKRALNASIEMDFEAAREVEIEGYGRCFDTEDRREGMAAFIEKRLPAWNPPAE